FRGFLSNIPSALLEKYATDCLTDKFDDKGFALQDIVNEVGHRLGFAVEHGRYRGTAEGRGHDGAWTFPNQSRTIVVEVKTTDVYRINLETLEAYRRSLIQDADLPAEAVTVLIVMGAEDTAGLEAQIRGSRYAWDVRLISVGALLRLLHLKEEAEDPGLVQRIRNILIPREFTRLDEIIEIAFSAAKDVREEAEEEAEETTEVSRKPKFVPVKFHDECIERVQEKLGLPLVKRTRSMYATAAGGVAVICSVSREHEYSGTRSYWFAFHPYQREALSGAQDKFVAFGCGSESRILLVPFAAFDTWLEGMNTTFRNDRSYWHVSIFQEDGRFVLHRKKGFERIDLTDYLLE
ncbi:MAG: hypothetical protein ACRD2L_10950, partial [Terriglobia bacterium]